MEQDSNSTTEDITDVASTEENSLDEYEYVGSERERSYHPLLNELILGTLAPFVSKKDIYNFREVCEKWKDAVEWKFRKECWVDLSDEASLYKFLEDFRSILIRSSPCNNGQGYCKLPFDSFTFSEIQFEPNNPNDLSRPLLTQSALDWNKNLFYNKLLPAVKQLQLRPDYISIRQFRKILETVAGSIRVLEIELDDNITTRPRIFRRDNQMVELPFLTKIRWLTGLDVVRNVEEFNGWSTDHRFNVGFLTELYSTATNIEHLECPVDSHSHLQALKKLIVENINPFQNLSILKLGVLNQTGFENLITLGKSKVRLKELSIDGIGAQVKDRTLHLALFHQKNTLAVLELGAIINNGRDDILVIELPILEKLKHLKLRFTSKMRFQTVDLHKRIPNIIQLHISGDTTDKDCLRSFYLAQSPMIELRRLEILLQHEFHYDNLAGFAEIFPSVTAVTLGNPSKNAIKLLWSLWPELRELKIITACHHIDEVLTGIPVEVCQRMLADRNYDEELLSWYYDEPSIRALKKLQRLELNGQLSIKFDSLSCLPSDVAAYMALMHLPELRYLVIHRSLISDETSSKLDESMANWTSKIDPIELKYDETIDAFQFHQNHQKFMKLLCRFPYQSLSNLPEFMTSLWMSNQLDL